jgi:hypothetical protein
MGKVYHYKKYATSEWTACGKHLGSWDVSTTSNTSKVDCKKCKRIITLSKGR